MIKKGHEKGTMIHGIAASEHIDSSGERIKIEGVDISSLTRDGIFNFEHQSKEASAIVGKIQEAKKILKRSDCENDYHRYFWDKIKMPFVYVSGELFDKEGHQAAMDVAAMAKYDAKTDKRKTKRLINFSIEGSRLEKDGANILKCIARKISITITPCNKVCEAEEMKEKKKTLLQESLGKSEESYCEIMKAAPRKYYTKLIDGKGKKNINYSPNTPGKFKDDAPKKANKKIKDLITSTSKPNNQSKDWRVGERTSYRDKTKMRTGKEIYNDPETWSEEPKEKNDGKLNKNFETSMFSNTTTKKPKTILASRSKQSTISERPKKQKIEETTSYKRFKSKDNRHGMRTGKEIYNDPETWKSEDIKKSKYEEKYHIHENGKKITKEPLTMKQLHEQHGGVKKIESKGLRVMPDRPLKFNKNEKMIKEHERLVGVLESPSHKDDKIEAKKQRKELKQYKKKDSKKKKYKAAPKKQKKKNFYRSNIEKALTAGSSISSPSAKTGGAALSKENVEKDMMQNVYKSISNDNWETFNKKEELLSFLSVKLTNISPREVLALAKSIAYLREKKKENKLKELLNE